MPCSLLVAEFGLVSLFSWRWMSRVGASTSHAWSRWLLSWTSVQWFLSTQPCRSLSQRRLLPDLLGGLGLLQALATSSHQHSQHWADHWYVNRGADQLASEGILLNAPALAVRISVLARASQALRWQATMLDILEKRWSSKPLPHRSAGYTQQQLDALE